MNEDEPKLTTWRDYLYLAAQVASSYWLLRKSRDLTQDDDSMITWAFKTQKLARRIDRKLQIFIDRKLEERNDR